MGGSLTTQRRPIGRAVMPVIMLALAAVVSAVPALNLATPSIAQDLDAGQTQISWVVDSYALVFAALLLPAGATGDRYGRRRALIVGLVIFAVGAGGAMMVNTPGQLIAVQGILGIGAALVMPATLSTITSTFPPERRVRAVGTWAGVSGASAMLGLLAAGVLLEFWSWRSVFALNIVLGLIALLGTLRFIPASADPTAPHLDIIGALISVVGLGVLVYSIIEAPTAGWGSARTIGGLAAAVVILAGFVGWELTRTEPLLDPRLFKLRGFTAGTITVTLQFFGFFGFVFLVVQYLQLVRGNSALVAALSTLPLAVFMMPSARALAPRAATRLGATPVMIVGLLLIAGGFGVLAQLETDSGYLPFLGGLLPLGLGMGLAMTPATSAITDALPPAKQGVGSAMNDLARQLGAALGIAVLGSITQSVYRDNLPTSVFPPQMPTDKVGKVRASLGASTHMADQVPAPMKAAAQRIAAQARTAFTDGMHNALLWATGLLIVTAVAVAATVTIKATRARPEAAGLRT
ncbi:MFS transporter [Streptomyces sp. YIM S03343]